MKHLLSLVILLAFCHFAAKSQTGSSLTYQITDVSGKDVANGHLDRNTSLAINVPTGLYTVRITGDGKYQAVKNVVIDEAGGITTSAEISTGTSSAVNIKNVTTGYIIVKVDNDGTFSCKKMLL